MRWHLGFPHLGDAAARRSVTAYVPSVTAKVGAERVGWSSLDTAKRRGCGRCRSVRASQCFYGVERRSSEYDQYSLYLLEDVAVVIWFGGRTGPTREHPYCCEEAPGIFEHSQHVETVVFVSISVKTAAPGLSRWPCAPLGGFVNPDARSVTSTGFHIG